MSFIEKNYKNGDTLFAKDLNNLVSGIKDANANIALKINASEVYTKLEINDALIKKADAAETYTKLDVNDALAKKANAAETYTKPQIDEKLMLKANANEVFSKSETTAALAVKANANDVYTKEQIDAKIASVFRYCGVIDTIAALEALPKENNQVGDAYKVLEDKNVYAWNGSSWDNLGEDVDLTPYLTKEEASNKYATIDDLESLTLDVNAKINASDADAKFALKTDIPDVTDFITTARTDEKIAASEAIADKKFALKTELPNVDQFITISATDEKIAAAELNAEADTIEKIKISEDKANAKFALKTDIPDVSGFAEKEAVAAEYLSKTDADAKFALKTNIPQVDAFITTEDADNKFALKSALDAFATSADVNEKLSLKADTATVNEQLSLKANKQDVDADIANKANIAVEGDMLVVNSKIAELEQKILNLSKTNIVEETISADANYNQPDADLVITGGDQAITEKTDIIAKSISLNQATAENAVLSAAASSGSISIQNFSNSGDLPKSTSNAAVKLNSNDTIIINKSNFSQTGYNSVEIGLNNTAPKSISIDGLDFTAPLSNNAILIFAHAKDAVINISNCHFADVSNALRLSNRLNVPATVNIVNCTVDKWDSRDKWAGFLIMGDYTSNTAEDAIAAKRFTNLTINFVNVKGPGGKLIKPDDIASICGTSNAMQAIYVYHEADDEVKPYSSGLYPKMTFA